MLLSGLALCFSCAVPRGFPEPEQEESPQQLSPNQPLLLALRDSVSDDDPEAAALVLERLGERELRPGEEQLVEGFKRILRGRDLVSHLDVSLVLREEEGQRRLFLRLATDWPENLNLAFPPITMEYACLVLSEAGELNRNLASQLLHPLEDLDLEVGVPKEVLLGDCPVKLPEGALAVRDAWRLSMRSGKIRTAEGSYPAERLPHPQLAQDTHADWLGEEVEDPVAFAAMMDSVLEQGGDGALELLISAARLDPERRSELLPLLAGVLADYANPLADRDGHLAAAVLPPLRWISPGVNVDPSLAAWSRWTQDWLQRSAQLKRARNRSGLVLP